MMAVRWKLVHRTACRELAYVVIAAYCACACGAQQTIPERSIVRQVTEQQETQAYRISGRVVDAHDGTPLVRCVVEIVDVKHGLGARTMLTSEDGHFLFEGVSPSKYRLSASKHGFVIQSYEQHDNFSTAIAVGP